MSDTLDTLFEDLKLRPITRHLAIALLFDLSLTPPELVDFGVDTDNHYRALKAVLLGGLASADARSAVHQTDQALCERVKELDHAYGHGPRLNALVRKYAPAYAQMVHFYTSWDELFGRTEEETPEER